MTNTRNVIDCVCLEIICADVSAILRRIEQSGCPVFNIKIINEMTAEIYCKKENLQQIKVLIKKCGAEIRKETSYGFGNLFKHISSRPLILTGIILMCCFLFVLQTRILFVRVEGNSCIPTNKIIEQARSCGISFGTSRRQIRSEGVKNALLDSIPQLKWVGINTRGCVATIHVSEKSIPEEANTEIGPGSIVAAQDGVIISCTVLDGTALCEPGDAVSAGQVLVSGYTDCGLMIKSVRADAEIIAHTSRDLTAISPHLQCKRATQLQVETKYTLRVGKKLINFFKDSGISDATCVKMYEENRLTLPGDFQLPVSLIVQRCISYSILNNDDQSVPSWLEGYCEDYLIRHMQAGQILHKQLLASCNSDACILDGSFLCKELIGQFRNEEIIDNDGKTN